MLPGATSAQIIEAMRLHTEGGAFWAKTMGDLEAHVRANPGEAEKLVSTVQVLELARKRFETMGAELIVLSQPSGQA